MYNRIRRHAIVLATSALAAAMLAAPFSASAATAAGHATHSPDTVIVKFAHGASSASKSALARAVDATGSPIAIKGTGAVTLPIEGSPTAAVKRLNASPNVEYAELNQIMTIDATPNDPSFGKEWDLNNTGQTGGTADADIDAPEGWDKAGLGSFPTTGGVKVGIVDTGIDKTHPEFAGGKISDCGGVKSFGISVGGLMLLANPTIVADKCTDDHGHGTHVAGTIAANANNGQGIAGVAFNAQIASCKALNSQGAGTLDMVANCINWLTTKGVKVISMSLGGSSGSDTLHAAVQNATNKGALVVAAAGNSGDSTLNYPAAYSEVVSVGATDNKDAYASFSTYNSDVEVSAPGVDILSTWKGGGYNTISGTSMATPHASGVAAVIAALNPSGGPAAWRSKLDSSVDDLGASGRDVHYGFGRVNLAKAAG